MAEKMIVETQGGIGWLTINNPDRQNAVSIEMAQRGAEIISDLSDDESVRAIVIRGAGERAWMSGADIRDFRPDTTDEGSSKNGFSLYESVYACAKPVVASIHGFCMGGGVALACACDLRIVATNALFAVPAGRLGIAYPPQFVSWMVDTIGIPNAKEMLLTGRRYSADDAFRLNLANLLVSPSELARATQDYVSMIAENAPLSVRANKTIIKEIGAHPSNWNAALCASLVDTCRKSADFAEGKRAFAEKRKPVFIGA